MKAVKMSKEQREALTDKIVEFFEMERGESMGRLAAEQVLDFVWKELGPTIYNQALSDARTVVRDRMQSLEDELYSLEQIAPRR